MDRRRFIELMGLATAGLMTNCKTDNSLNLTFNQVPMASNAIQLSMKLQQLTLYSSAPVQVIPNAIKFDGVGSYGVKADMYQDNEIMRFAGRTRSYSSIMDIGSNLPNGSGQYVDAYMVITDLTFVDPENSPDAMITGYFENAGNPQICQSEPSNGGLIQKIGRVDFTTEQPVPVMVRVTDDPTNPNALYLGQNGTFTTGITNMKQANDFIKAQLCDPSFSPDQRRIAFELNYVDCLTWSNNILNNSALNDVSLRYLSDQNGNYQCQLLRRFP